MSFAAVLSRLQTLENPYPGLRPFETEEAHLFFGRDQQIAEVVGRLERNRLLAVLGVSGSGKSSLVRAGMIPALERGSATDPGRHWRIVVTRPSGAPFESLAAALVKSSLDPAGLRTSSLGLVQISRQLSPDERLLVIVDQFEEIFRYKDVSSTGPVRRRDLAADAAADAAEFAQLLLAAGRAHPPVYVVLTMRSDYLGDCAEFRDLPEALNDSQYLLPRMTREQRKEAIERPLGRVEISPSLVQRMLNDAGDEPDQLPVLQHALMRTWSHWRRSDPGGTRRIDLSDYREIGGFDGALDAHAEELLVGVPRDLTAIVFKRLTARGRGRRERRDPARLSELWELCGAETPERRHEVTGLVEHFRRGEATFLVPRSGVLGPDTYIDITHESLIRQWATLRDTWLREEEDSAKTLLALAQRSKLWTQQKGELLSGADLASALEWNEQRNQSSAWAEHYADASALPNVLAFLAASERYQRAAAADRARERKRLRIAMSVAAFAIVGVLVAIGFSQYWGALIARRAAMQARILSAPTIRDPLVRALLLTELGDGATDEQLPIYQEAATAAIPYVVQHHPANAEVKGIRFLGADRIGAMFADGTVASWRRDGRGQSDQVTLVQVPRRAAPRGRPWLSDMAFSPDGRWVAMALCASDVWLKRVDAAAGSPVAPPADTACTTGPAVTALAFSRDGRQLAVGYTSAETRIWSLDGDEGRPKGTPITVGSEQNGSISSIDFDPTGASIATGSDDGSCRIWSHRARPRAPDRDYKLGANDPVTSVGFSPDGTWLLCGYTSGVARIWNTAEAGPEGAIDLKGHTGAVTAVAFSPTQTRVATASEDRTAHIWMLKSNRQCAGTAAAGLQTIGFPRTLGHDSIVTRIAFSGDGKYVLTSEEDAGVRMWVTEQEEPRILGVHDGAVESVAFDRDGTRVASASDDHTARLWAIDRPSPPVCFEGHEDWVRYVAFSPADRQTLVTASEDHKVRVWDASSGRGLRVASERDRLFAAAFDPTGRRVVTAAADNAARIWTLAALQRGGYEDLSVADRPIQLTHESWVLSAAFNNDGSKIVTGSKDGTVRVWSSTLAADKPEREFPGSSQHPAFSVAFSPDGTRIVGGLGGRLARIWRLDGSGEAIELRHLRDVKKVAFNPTGDLVLTASMDGTAKLWNARGLERLALAHGDEPVMAAAFDPSSTHVATGTQIGVVRLWRVTLPELRAYLEQATTACLTPAARVQYLGDSEDAATAASERCEARHGRSAAAPPH